MIVKFRLRQLIAIKSATDDQRVTYRDIMAATGINQNSLTAMVNNKQKQIALRTISKLCNFFECEIGDLLTLENVERTEK